MGKNVIFMLLTILYLLITCVGVASLSSSTDEDALLAFKAQITSDPSNILAKNWSQATSFCNWIGITCGPRHRRVRHINLSRMGLRGTIANEIGQLSFLRSFDIGNNSFHGNIPPSLGTCKNLEQLSMYLNNLDGIIPVEIANLTKLQLLNIAGNNLIGTIPPLIGNLSNLRALYLLNNSLEGHVPQELGHLSNLMGLELSFNRLEGEIPPSIFNLSMLELLGLSYNYFVGKLPSSLPNGLPRLRELYIGNNSLGGQIPRYFSNFSSLTRMDIGNNSFIGQVPSLENLVNLQWLDLYNNHLTNDPSMVELDVLVSLRNCRNLTMLVLTNNLFYGMIPKDLGNLSASLEIFHGYSCGIKGKLPSEIGNMSNLIWLEMGGNELIGQIPQTLGNMRKLQRLELFDNKLQGSIPDDLCNLLKLFHLDLSNNQLTQEIPTCLGNLIALQELNLSCNSLTSSIPPTLQDAEEIQTIDLSFNVLSGSLSPEIGSMKWLRVLNLSRNQLSGDIPSSLGQLQSLEILRLSDNRLGGPIPDLFGNLISLRNLDLSENNLRGVIPKSFEKLSGIVYFNVSFNELIGEIPNGGSFNNLTSDSFLGNPKLCGASQYKVSPCENGTKSSSKMRVLKYILPSVGVMIILVIGTVYFMRRRGINTLIRVHSTSPVTIKRISYYEVVNATNEFGEENRIGKGSIGSVYKGTLPDGTIAAIKVFDLDLEDANKSFETECTILCNIRHRNLVKVISCCSNLDLKALVLEFLPNGNLDQWLYSSNYCLSIAQRLDIMMDVAFALEYLHHGYTSPIVHCDLKPSNILLDEDMVARVADFGVSKLFTEEQRISLTKTLGTVGYMAPEYGSTGLISTMADVYSYGIVLMETFTNKKPTDDMFVGEFTMRRWVFEFTMRRWVFESFTDAITQIVDVNPVNAVEDRIQASENCVRSIMGLALECTTDMPEERIDMKDVLTRLRKIKIELL